ncbi:MAG: cytochrome c [Crocinitomicaceae bacterium]
MNKILFFCTIAFLILLFSFSIERGEWTSVNENTLDEMSLDEVRMALGGEKSEHYMADYNPEKARIGLELILNGKRKKGLFKSKAISSYFVCTDCHNLNAEFSDAADQNPVDRLDYARKNKIPFLPGSTFWGIYNRKTFYNDDYVKKYGELIDKAKNSLPASIQVCAKYCSSGRNLKDWELEAIMHYFKQTELHLKDIRLTFDQKQSLANLQKLSTEEKKELLKEIESKYTSGYSAHFMETMPRDDRKYGAGGDAEKGKYIYDNSCLFCHLDGRVTYLKLDNDKLSAKLFLKNKTNYSDLSIYQIIRQGTYAMPGRNQYMPRFTKDKMSDQQIEDLMAYLNQLAEK